MNPDTFISTIAHRDTMPALDQISQRQPAKGPGLLVIVCTLMFLLIAVSGQATVITDSDGVEHRFEAPFKRIISLYPAHTENLVEMGGEDNLIGISTADTYPPSVLAKPRFSYHDSLEKFIAARPDCILIRPMIAHATPNLVNKLRHYGITVISLQPTSIKELFSYWENLGSISGAKAGARDMILAFQAGLDKMNEQVKLIPEAKRPRVYFEAIHARMKTFSPDSIAMFCLRSAGGINVATDADPRRSTNIAAYSKERILARAEEIEVFLAQYGRMNRISVEEIVNEPGFGAIAAIRSGRVHLVEEHLVSRPTTRLLEGIETINRLLYRDNLSLTKTP